MRAIGEGADCERCREGVSSRGAHRRGTSEVRERGLGEDAARSEIVSDGPDRSFASVLFILDSSSRVHSESCS